MNSNMKKALLGIALVLCCGIMYYFMYWTKTPAYSLNIMREAVEKHDIVLFEKHFDADSFMNRAFDDVLIAQEQASGIAITDNPLGAGIVGMLKPPVVDVMKNKMREAVLGAPAPAGKNKAAEKLASGMERRLPAFNKISEVSTISEDDLWAHVAVKLHDAQLDKPLTLKLKMYRLPDDTWQVKECTNLVEFTLERERLVKEKLAELNREVEEELQKYLAFSEESSRIYSDDNPFLPSYRLVSSFTVKNISDKKITSFKGQYVLPGSAQGTPALTKGFSSEKPLAPGEELSGRIRWNLNPFIPEEQSLVEEGNTSPQGYNRITAVTLADGTAVELLEELPSK